MVCTSAVLLVKQRVAVSRNGRIFSKRNGTERRMERNGTERRTERNGTANGTERNETSRKLRPDVATPTQKTRTTGPGVFLDYGRSFSWFSLRWRCVLFTPGSWFDPRSLVFWHRHGRPDALMPILIGHIIESALLGSPDGALRSNRPHGEVCPIARAVAVSPSIVALGGRKVGLRRRSGSSTSIGDAAASRSFSGPPGSIRRLSAPQMALRCMGSGGRSSHSGPSGGHFHAC